MVKGVIFYCLLLGLLQPCALRAGEKETAIDNAIEFFQQYNTDEIDLEALTFTFEYFFEHPINLNHFNLQDVIEFPLINHTQWITILQHQRKHGAFLFLSELGYLPRFSQQLLQVIGPFVFIGAQKKQMAGTLNYQWLSRIDVNLQTAAGYTKPDSLKYLGAPVQYINQIQVKNKKHRAYISWRQDKGELIQNGNLKYGYQGSFNNNKTQVNIGALALLIGEGLTVSNGLNFGKNAPLLSFKNIDPQLRIQTSSSTFNYLRGIAATHNYKKLQTLVFYANTPISGNLSDDEQSLTSIKNDGLFRTENEINKRNVANVQLLGGTLTAKYNTVQLGYSLTTQQLSAPYQPEVNYYNKWFEMNKKMTNQSVYYRYFNGDILSKAEIAFDTEYNTAFTAFNIINLTDDTELLLNFRHFASNYQAINGNTFREGSRTQNERGFYLAAEKTAYPFNFFVAHDYFIFQQPKYLVSTPSKGREFTFFSTWAISDSLQLKLYFQIQNKQKNASNSAIDQVVNYEQQRAYLKLSYSPTTFLKLTTRADFTSYNADEGNKNGFAVYQDFQITKNKHKVTARYAVINTPDWDTRIYAYEHDVLYAFFIPAYYDNATRFYINYSYKASDKLSFWLRYAQTHFNNKQSVGSGFDEIEGSLKSNLKAQVIWKI